MSIKMKCRKLLAGTGEGLLEGPHQLIVDRLSKYILLVLPAGTFD